MNDGGDTLGSRLKHGATNLDKTIETTMARQDSVSAEDKRRQVLKILKSEAFKDPAQLRDLFECMGARTLAGKAAALRQIEPHAH
jgi:hypothetical protein